MDINDQLNPADDRSSTERHAPSPADEIAISALDLIDMIKAGNGSDVNELISQMLRERPAA